MINYYMYWQPVAMDRTEHGDKIRFDGRITRLIFPYGLLFNAAGNAIYMVREP